MTVQTSNVTIQISEMGNLPAALTTFVGRRRDLAEVRRGLGATRLLTLTGMGGVGKTRLALEAVASVADFVDGVWLVDLAAVRDPSLVANATATALGVPDLGTRPVIDQLAAFLAHRAPLIVLDNCEHLIDACAELAHALLSASPDCAFWRRAAGRWESAASTSSPSLRWRRTTRRNCCGTGPSPCARSSGSPTPTAPRSSGCARAWTGCRWPSNWPRPGCGC